MIEIREEKPSDYSESENVLREAFWNVYSPGCSEHYMVHRIRESDAYIPELSFVAIDTGKIIGYVTNVKSHIEGDDGKQHEVLSLGPIAVLPGYQRSGLGAALISKVKTTAKEMGFQAILLYGNPAFYTKQGFESAEKYCIRNSENMFAAALHVSSLHDGALDNLAGRYIENGIYEFDEDDLQIFDKAFPPKTRVTGTPSQLYFLKMVNSCHPYAGK